MTRACATTCVRARPYKTTHTLEYTRVRAGIRGRPGALRTACCREQPRTCEDPRASAGDRLRGMGCEAVGGPATACDRLRRCARIRDNRKIV